MRKRTKAREFALQILYQEDISHSDVDEVFEDFWKEKTGLTLFPGEDEAPEEHENNAEVRQYTERIVRGTIEKLEIIDKMIERFAEHWELKRMAYVDRNILRLAAYEMMFIDEIPVKVAINEAVELAKRYGEADSSKFVNGILDKIAKMECKK
ncbi:MAG: transcription antitermination factor NusB [Omnitrophica bacterium RIFCSPHIGHO2_02_FULL_51_18]|nr:MAG: transcription antitermination factor NusB [Omnitrophica bacterium RIFCSPHIGHO2_02_FULL_51_18]